MIWTDLLEAPLWLPVLLVTMLSAATIIPVTLWALRKPRLDRGNDNTVTAAVRLAGSALILIGGFIAVQNFQLEVQHDTIVTDELNKAVSVLEAASLSSPPTRLQLGEAIKAYGKGIATFELNRLTGLPHITGTLGDERVEPLVLAMQLAVDQAVRELNTASRAAEAQSLRTAWRSFLNLREQRVSYRELLPGSLVVVLLICSVCTLIVLGAVPAGPSSGLKWLQALTGAVIVSTLLALQVVIVSPRAVAEHRVHLVDRLTQSVDRMLTTR